MKKPVSPELAKKMDRANAMFAILQERHVAWVIGGALEHFVDAIERTENDIVRNERFQEDPRIDRFGGTQSRREALARDADRRRDYTAIVRFLKALNDAHQHASAEGFAQGLADSGFFGKR